MRNLIEVARKSQDHPTPRLAGRPSVGTNMFCDSRVAITGQRNHQPNCEAIYVLLKAKERAQCISALDVDVDLCVVPCFAEYRTKVNL